jgi:hypothetical protein
MASAFEMLDNVPWEQAGTAATFLLNQTGDRVTWLFMPRDLSALAEIWVSIGTISGSPQLRASLQSLASTGRESGTILAGGNAYIDFSPSANTQPWRNLTASYTPTTRQPIALVLQLLSGTSAVVNVRLSSTLRLTEWAWTYDEATQSGTDGTRATGIGLFGVRASGTAGTVNGTPAIPGNLVFSSTGTSEYGNLYAQPQFSQTQTLVGLDVGLRLNASASAVGRLYLGAATTATTLTTSTPTILAANCSATSAYYRAFLPFETPTTINAGDSFRVSLAANNTNQIGLGYWDVAAAEDATAWGSWGANCYATSRAAGNWTNLTTRIYALRPVYSDMTKGAAGMLPRRTLRPL